MDSEIQKSKYIDDSLDRYKRDTKSEKKTSNGQQQQQDPEDMQIRAYFSSLYDLQKEISTIER